LGEGGRIALELLIESGKGYISASQRDNENAALGTIVVDSLFSPVRHAAFRVEHTRVGQVTDYDRLFLTVETDGSISPEDAVGATARILQDQLNKFISFVEPVEEAAVSGEVTAINQALEAQPGTINDDPEGSGWFMKLKLSNVSELSDLMSEADYKTYLASI
jgi:DNA-directed RNA polymerase alpha subunit